MKNTFNFFLEIQEPTNNFNYFVKHTLSKEKYIDHFLVRAGVIAVSDILKAIGTNFAKYSNDYVPLLHFILEEEDVKKEIKLNVITLLGDICLAITAGFKEHLKPTMEILIGACELAVSISEDDSDFEEYLQSLRSALISTFTCIYFGLEEGNIQHIFYEYVQVVFKYFETLLSGRYVVSLDMNKSMLGFVMDMMNVLGKEIKKVLNIGIVEKMIVMLKESKSSKNVDYAKECERQVTIIWQLS